MSSFTIKEIFPLLDNYRFLGDENGIVNSVANFELEGDWSQSVMWLADTATDKNRQAIHSGIGLLVLSEEAQALGVERTPIISLAKREEDIFFPGRPESLRLSRRSPSLRLLQRLRDETHRFGVAYNRKRRTKRTITSALLDIPGVGPSHRRVLLERFGSLAGVRSATAAEIASLPGFSATLAERILTAVRQ